MHALIPEARSRNLKKAPFVEMAEGRIQGVISSGSDIERVYISYFKKDSYNYYCSTNNNRPCGGLRGGPCKHLHSLLDETVRQYGAERVINYLSLNLEPEAVKKGSDLLRYLNGNKEKEPAATVFSRFLTHLRQLELTGSNRPMPEMNWFILPEVMRD
ncbi:MAG: hypothetical protein GY795_02470 [Desulfobacterales bacterium]|nr:hypothetical protein [Desulfobacterales bacterium]